MSAPARTLRSARDLVEAGLLSPADVESVARIARRYAVAVTPAMAALMLHGEEKDGIARQFLPSRDELVTTPDELADPIGDEAHSPLPGIVHRYPDRVLLKLLLACPVYCRFCFRREVVGPGAPVLPPEAVEAALDYIAGHPEIWEVILTGGDPLMLSARRLKDIIARLAAIAHVKIIRLHSRVPSVAPERITPALVAALRTPSAAVYLALHANHPRELTGDARAACSRLVDAGIVMLSQSVLLRGVNDRVEILADLMSSFVEMRIKPYYLHHPDLAPGTSHFRVTIAEGQALVRGLQGTVSGLCQPTYVLDIPGGYGKAPIGPAYLTNALDGEMIVTDFRGGQHAYPPPQR